MGSLGRVEVHEDYDGNARIESHSVKKQSWQGGQ